VERIRRIGRHRRAAVAWTLVLGLQLVALVVGAVAGFTDPALRYWMVGGTLVAAGAVYAHAVRARSSCAAAAGLVEAAYPDLKQRLATAVELRPADADRSYAFLEARLLEEVLAHARDNDWSSVRPPGSRVAFSLHSAALLGAAALAVFVPLPERDTADPRRASAPSSFEVTPGDVEVERGSTVVVVARFEGTAPDKLAVAWHDVSGRELTTDMARGTGDPVFAHTFHAVERDTSYRIVGARGESTTYRISVYDRPALVRADAVLDFPAYTSQAPRALSDIRRFSAVEGTDVSYAFRFNKPVRSAVLRATDGATLEPRPSPEDPALFLLEFPLAETKRYALHLEDTAGRTNAWPDDFRFEAVPNHRPRLVFEHPAGDQRLSALEEMRVAARASDDFGLLDFGIGFSTSAVDPVVLSLRGSADGTPLEADFEHLVALEDHAVAPDDLVSWFAWADDHGPHGQRRRTTSDLFFGEIRPFDEIFREQAEGGGGQQPGGSGQQAGEQLVETQRQIALALWNLRQRSGDDDTLTEDARAVADAQQRARRQLQQMRPRLEGDRARSAADAADIHMSDTLEAVAPVAAGTARDTLDVAWREAQGAYRALLRLAPRENRVAQSRGGQQGQSAARNQRQLDQLRFRSDDDPYETRTRAEALTSEEEREQMQTVSRLRDLARRQQDLNQELQRLQTALAAAENEEQREAVRRELQRLEEEQRRMVADLDDLRQRLDRRSTDATSREASRRLEQTRERMQEAGEALRQGGVSEALASGTRARDELDETRDSMRRESSSRFAEDLRRARREARSISESQQSLSEELQSLRAGAAQSLDDSEPRRRLADRMEQDRERLDALLADLRRVAEDAEAIEPGLHDLLYDMLREHGSGATGDALESAAELLRRGFVQQAGDRREPATRTLEELRTGIERAAEAVLGDELTAMRYAADELEDLSRSLAAERDETESDGTSRDSGYADATSTPGSSTPLPSTAEATAGGGGGARPADTELDEAMQSLVGTRTGGASGESRTGPLTGTAEGWAEWNDRLRILESVVERPDARERLAAARAEAEALRQEFRRRGTPPRWGSIESGVAVPLSEVRAILRSELARRDDPEALQPIDRDPVPEHYAESVRRYYEALGR
jgi:hypothetical protein